MVVFSRGFENLLVADALEPGARHLTAALFGSVDQTKLYRVHIQLAGELVYRLLGGEGGRGRAGRAVGGGFLLVDQHVHAFDERVRDVVGREHGAAAGCDGRAGERARLVGQMRFGGGHLAGCLGAELDGDVGA